jgi:hypothetical protein
MQTRPLHPDGVRAVAALIPGALDAGEGDQARRTAVVGVWDGALCAQTDPEPIDRTTAGFPCVSGRAG